MCVNLFFQVGGKRSVIAIPFIQKKMYHLIKRSFLELFRHHRNLWPCLHNMYTYTPQFNDDKQRAGGVLFPFKTTGAETHFIWIWKTVLCRHDLIFQLLVYSLSLTIFHLEHLSSDQTKAGRIASLALGVVIGCTPAHTGTSGQSKENTYAIPRLVATGYQSDELWGYPAGKFLITLPLYRRMYIR